MCTEGQASVYFTVVERFLSDLVGSTSDQWVYLVNESTPQQTNGYDCGLFTCINLELLSRNQPLDYEVADDFSEEARKRIAVELMFGHLLTI